VLSYEDTVHAKKAAGREQDLLDARSWKRTKDKKLTLIAFGMLLWANR